METATSMLQQPKALSVSDLPKHFWMAKSKQCPKQLSLVDPVELNAATKLLLLSVVATTDLSVEFCQIIMISSIDFHIPVWSLNNGAVSRQKDFNSQL